MKHLFLVHSHTPFLTAIGVIEKLSIPQEDVIFVYSRHYKNNLPYHYKTFDFSQEVEESFHMMLSFSRRNFAVNRDVRDRIVGFFDDFVRKEVQEAYCLYVPQLQSPTFQIFATNPLCSECFFIQEGGRIMYDFVTDKNLWPFKLYNKIVLRGEKRFWKCKNWFPASNDPYNRPITVFAFDEKYFGSQLAKVISVHWPKLSLDLQIDTQCPIFALEGAVELGQIEKNVYMKAVDDLIKQCGAKKNYIKFHPIQSEEIKAEYRKMFYEKGMELEDLPMNTPFELIVSSFEHLTVCGFGSSLLFYAKAHGHTVISNEEKLKKSAKYRMYCKKLSKL